jgi:Methyltransferase domain
LFALFAALSGFNNKTDLAPGVTFHKLGLQADGTNMAQTHAAEYDAIDHNLLLPLDQIMKRLGHEQQSLDLLMMDCEGCEWGVLRHLACSKKSNVVKQIVVEFHFQSNLGLESKIDVEHAAEAVQCLWDDRWHITSIEGSGAGRANWMYAPGVPSIIHNEGMLLYVALQRIPEGEPTPTELLKDLASAGHDLGKPYEDALNTFGTDPK